MSIGASEIELEETSTAHGLQVNVVYFTLPGEPFAGLVRQVTVKNTGAEPLALELLDGLPGGHPVWRRPTAISSTSGAPSKRGWRSTTSSPGIPFYRVQASVGDEAEVAKVEAGHFYLPFVDRSRRQRARQLSGVLTADIIVDPPVIFEQRHLPQLPRALREQHACRAHRQDTRSPSAARRARSPARPPRLRRARALTALRDHWARQPISPRSRPSGTGWRSRPTWRPSAPRRTS